MANIKIKNKQGQEVTFTNVPKLTADKVGGGTQDFIIPSGTKSITANGTQDVTNFASVNVNVPNPSTGTLEITENGTYDVTEKASVEVNVASSGASAHGAGVKFIDYDGTLVDFWSASDVASKTALPDNPTGHTRLVAEGWNWTLTKIKAYMASHPDAVMTVGQMYHTASGKTELDITVTKVTGLTVTCNISGEKDWGDGTTDSTSSHTYTDYSGYTIKCSGTTVSGNIFGTTSSNTNRFWCTAVYIASGVTKIGNNVFRYCDSLTSITIPDGVTSIAFNAFSYCRSLTSITIPDGVTSIDDSTFDWCHSLTSVTIPDGVTSIRDNTFYFCYSLTSITIPDSVTSIGKSALHNCYSLTSVTIPNGVTSIGNTAFYDCYSIIKYDFSSATAVPTLSNTNAFADINGICKIVVPDALYDNWIEADNWSTYANYIYKASEVT